MKPKEIYTLAFDPEKSNDKKVKKIFESKEGQILWCCIKQTHLTDQHFNDKILGATKEIHKAQEAHYNIGGWGSFMKIVSYWFRGFGEVKSGIFDTEFWHTIYVMITCHNVYFKYNIKEKK